MTEWQPFYATVAAVVATLTGLLFVGLSLNRERLAADENRGYRRLALRSFEDYLFVLAVAIIMLIPRLDGRWIGQILFVLGATRSVRLVRNWQHPAYRHLQRRTRWETAREYGFPLASCLGLCGLAAAIYLGQYKPVYYVVVILVELLFTASRGAWRLLMLEDAAART